MGGGESWRPLVERLLDAVRQPCTVDSAANVHLSASIGVSCFPYDADTVEVLAQQAESAMQGGQRRWAAIILPCSSRFVRARRRTL